MPQFAYFETVPTGPAPVIGWYDTDALDYPNLPGSSNLLELTAAQWASHFANPSGWAVSNGSLVGYTPPAAAPTLEQQAQSALSAGLAITSTSTPALNGTYAVDQLSQSDIIAVETSLNAGKGFPAGSTTFSYPDASGALHAFSEANFTNFAAAVRDFVYGCRSVIAGQSSTLPASTVTIA